LKTVSKIVSALLLIAIASNLGFAEETSFRKVQVPTFVKGKKTKQVKAVIAFSDEHQAIEVYPAKGSTVSIPFSEIDKCSYEYTQKHRIKAGLIVFFVVDMPAGVIVMFTKSRSHWLEIDYHEKELPKAFIVRMDKKNYIRILDAVRSHTGKEAEVLGNADKR
jgi:hypothetical protein